MSTFMFKQFAVQQERSAQKIGTDAVLLGAWCHVDHTISRVLDIGAGTGVLALMLAQRLRHAQIDGIEIDDDAFEEATLNFENSPWADRLFCYHASFQEFYEEDDIEFYDLIISNPPFFEKTENDNQDIDSSRAMARFDDYLPFEELVYGVYKLLSQKGTFACIIPKDRESRFLEITEHFLLFPTRITSVKGNAGSEVKRVLMEFSFGAVANSRLSKNITPARAIIDELILEKSRHNYTDAYHSLVKDFYLKL
jgi:tRNA1Val (adenine37-N6)-methyltransferase